MKILFKNIIYYFRKCKNIIRWIPTLWKDEDWDDAYIVDILIKKLEHQRDFFLSDRALSMESEKTAAEIQYVIDMLNKTKDPWEFYELPAVESMDEKWGEGVIRFEPIEGEDAMTMHVDYPNVKTSEDEKQHSKEHMDNMAKALEQYKKDKQATYLFIANNIDKWWD